MGPYFTYTKSVVYVGGTSLCPFLGSVLYCVCVRMKKKRRKRTSHKSELLTSCFRLRGERMRERDALLSGRAGDETR